MQAMTITGRIGKDAESRKTQNGDDVCAFTVAVDQGYGQNKSTNWYRVSLWGKRGASLGPYLLKGQDVTVNGEFSLGDYQGKPQLEIRANDVALQGGKRGGDEAPRRQPARGESGHIPGFDPADDLDSDSGPF